MLQHFLIAWVLNTAAILVTAKIVPGVHVNGIAAAAIAALVVGVVAAVVKPILIVLTLPITILTLGLFLFVVGGIAFYIAASLTPGFRVEGFGSAMLGAIVLGVINWAMGVFVHRPVGWW
jgi:putative membrane protein